VVNGLRPVTSFKHSLSDHRKVYSFKVEGQIEPCDMMSEMKENGLLAIIGKVAVIIICLAGCCVAALCSYMSLERRYQKLESKRLAHQSWLVRMKDMEKGELKNMFVANVKKG